MSRSADIEIRVEGDTVSLNGAASAWFALDPNVPVKQFRAAGPALHSPSTPPLFAHWLLDQLAKSGRNGRWIVSIEGGQTLDVSIADATALLTTADRSASRRSKLRHDVRNQINSLQVNADLVAMLAERSAQARIAESTERLRNSLTRLNGLLETGLAEDESPQTTTPLAAGLGIACAHHSSAALPIPENHPIEVSSEWCVASARVIGDWLDWLGFDAIQISGVAVDVDMEAGHLSLVTRDVSDVPAQPLWPLPGDANATPDTLRLLPVAGLLSQGVGFGYWFDPELAGLRIAFPA